MKMKQEDPKILNWSIRDEVEILLKDMSSFEVVYNCSPELRKTLPYRMSLTRKFLASLKD
jgi:hypothetical protein